MTNKPEPSFRPWSTMDTWRRSEIPAESPMVHVFKALSFSSPGVSLVSTLKVTLIFLTGHPLSIWRVALTQNNTEGNGYVKSAQKWAADNISQNGDKIEC